MKQKNIKINKKLEAIEKSAIIKRIQFLLLLFFLLLGIIILRIMYIQFIKGPEYKEAASRQQLLDQTITPKRGTIYDSTGKALAISASVDTITINPQKIIVTDKDPENQKLKTKERKELVSKAFSDIFELDYNEVFEKVNSDSTYEVIAEKVEHSKVEELEKWMNENNIYNGINIDESNTRFYPYQTLASNLIGFCGTEGYGLEGLESKLDSILAGIPRKKSKFRKF